MFHGEGLYIDKTTNRYKKYVSFLFFKIGDWKPLPKISFVALTKVLSIQNLNNPQGVVASVSLKGKLYCVYLCVDSKRKILVCKTKNKQEALKLANGAANYLEVSLNNFVKEG